MTSPSFAAAGATAAFHLTRRRLSVPCASVKHRPLHLAAVTVATATTFFGAALLVAARPRPALAEAPPLREEQVVRMGEEEEEEEVEMYERLLEEQPKNVEALKCVAFGRMRKGKVKDAVKYVDRLVEIEPGEVEWRLLRALSAELLGDLQSAKALFSQILKDDPLQMRALHGLALAMQKCNEGVAAFEMLNKALELAHNEHRIPEECDIKILIAQMHIVKGDLAGASKKFQDLINENPRDFRPYLYLGIIYSLQGKNSEADEQFEMYRSLVPEEFPSRSFVDDMISVARAESLGERSRS